jgi:hypothetical protein
MNFLSVGIRRGFFYLLFTILIKMKISFWEYFILLVVYNLDKDEDFFLTEPGELCWITCSYFNEILQKNNNNTKGRFSACSLCTCLNACNRQIL